MNKSIENTSPSTPKTGKKKKRLFYVPVEVGILE